MFTSHQLQLYPLLPNFVNANHERGKIKGNPACCKANYHYPQYQSLFKVNLLLLSCNFLIIKLKMLRPISPESNDSDFFYVEHSSNEPSPPRPNKPIVLNFTEMSGKNTRELITLSSIASPEPQIVTIDSDSNEPTLPYGFERQLPNIPPSLNNLNLSPNPFNILATMVVANPSAEGHDDDYSPQSPEPSEPSPILTPSMNLSTIEGWETPHTTSDDNTFYSNDDPRRFNFLLSSPSSQPPPR